jgi:hypothetical protein
MLRKRLFVAIFGLAAAAFLALVAVGIAGAPTPASGDAAAKTSAALARVVDGMARETFASD